MINRTIIALLSVLNLFFEVINGISGSVSAPRVCIIGAGYSGLGTARYMKDYGLNFTVFEASRYIGGTWRFDPRVGTDEDGTPSFTSAYKDFRTNTITQTLEYSEFPFPEGSASFLPGSCVYKYLQAFTKRFDLMKNIQFQSLVTRVQWTGDNWNVLYMKTNTKENVTEECNYVVVATGEYSLPNIPSFKGQEEFRGKIMHSHDYKDSEDFRDLRVLVVGAGPSGFDVVTQLVNVSTMVLHSHHSKYKLPTVPGNYVMKSDIEQFTTTGAVFVDGSSEEFDIVILCTGYFYNIPFLNYEASKIVAGKKYILPLYNQVVNINHPSMTFVGTARYNPGLVRDIQGHYSAALAAGKIKLPPQEEMFLQWFEHAKNKSLNDVNVIGHTQYMEYLEVLLKDTTITRPSPIIATAHTHTRKDTFEDFLNFRHNQFLFINDTHYEKVYMPMERKCLIDV